jgi:hypoxanthine-DNA glycosylase
MMRPSAPSRSRPPEEAVPPLGRGLSGHDVLAITQARATPTEGGPPLLDGLPPVLAADARLVVLGSFPGVASLQARAYYAHPRNQFWPLLSAIWGVDLVAADDAWRRQTLIERRVGLWDVYAHCRRQGSLDSAIRDAQLNDLGLLRRIAPGLRAIAHNGGASAREARLTQALGVAVHRLPSSSPAHASWNFQRKHQAWAEVFRLAGVA